jgi:hypothetical protein
MVFSCPGHNIFVFRDRLLKCYGPDKKILFKKLLFDLEVKGQGLMKVIMVCDTPPYGHAPTYQISLTYLVRNNYFGSCALPPRWPPQCSCIVIESSFDPGERLQAPGSLNCFSMRNLQNRLVLIHGIPIYKKNYQNVKQYVILYLII